MAQTRALLDRYTTLTQRLGEDYSDAALEEMGRLQEQLDSRNAWDLDSRLDQALDAWRPNKPG